VSPLESQWLEMARESAEATSADKTVHSPELPDRRVTFTRSVVCGGIVDARSTKPGVLLSALTSDGEFQELGVSSREQATHLVLALMTAWPDLLGAGCSSSDCCNRPVTGEVVRGRYVRALCQRCLNGRGPILRPRVLAGDQFDWEEGERAMGRIVDEGGEISMGAAMAADPGVTRCPTCGTYHWREGTKRQCAREGCLSVWGDS